MVKEKRKQKKYQSKYIDLVRWYVMWAKDKSDKGIALYFEVHRDTINRWRKKYPEFDDAIRYPTRAVTIAQYNLMLKCLTEKRVDLTLDGDGNIKEQRVINPGAQDLAVAHKIGFKNIDKFVNHEADDQRRCFLAQVIERYCNGEITAKTAALMIEGQGYDVPPTLAEYARAEGALAEAKRINLELKNFEAFRGADIDQLSATQIEKILNVLKGDQSIDNE